MFAWQVAFSFFPSLSTGQNWGGRQEILIERVSAVAPSPKVPRCRW